MRSRLLKRLLYGVVGLVLSLLSLFFAFAIQIVVRTEVWPSIQQGTLDVQTDTMILNVLWEGNEIYVLLSFYLLMTVTFAIGAFRLIVAATRGA